jgi:hypothetical protein
MTIPIKLLNAVICGTDIYFTCNNTHFKVDSKHCIQVKEIPKIKEGGETMQHLKNAIIQEKEKKFKEDCEKLKTEEGIKQFSIWYKKDYKNNPEAKFKKFLEQKKNKEIAEALKKIEEAKNSPNLPNDFIITIEWKSSRMWGSNPKAYTNYGFEGSSIGGCGYDKQSTATAQALNSSPSILKLLYQAKDKAIKEHSNEKNTDGTSKTTSDLNRQYLSYGSGYNILPSFEGGTGVESHRAIIEGLGLKWQRLTNTPNTDIFIIKR